MTYYWTCMDCGGLVLPAGCNCNRIHAKGRETLRRIVEKREQERARADQTGATKDAKPGAPK